MECGEGFLALGKGISVGLSEGIDIIGEDFLVF